MNALLYTFGVVFFAVGVIVSIALHEVGHMWPAKKFGVKVTQYFVGFGRTVWSVRRGETEYGLKAIPLGGYVKLVGMLPPSRDEDPDTVRSTSTGLMSQLQSSAREAELEHVGPDDHGRLFYEKPWWQKVIVMAGGPMMNVVIAFFLFAVVLMGYGAYEPRPVVATVSDCAIADADIGRTCTADDPVTPAKRAGLQPGDRFISIGGTPVESWRQASELIRAAGDREVVFVLERDGRRISETIRPTVLARASLEDVDRTERVGFLGVSPEITLQRQGLGDVFVVMGQQTKATGAAVIALPQRMVEVAKAAVGYERPQDGPVSVVGASRVAGEMSVLGNPSWTERVVRILTLLAGLNLFLALFNLIPLLPLDGGHIAGALWEAIRRGWARLRGRPDPGYVDVAKMLPVAYGVGVVLIVMSVILIYADIVNPVRLS